MPEARISNLHTLMNSPRNAPRWVVKELLPEGVALLCGKPKKGKSWLALLIGLCVAMGIPVLGHHTVQGDVLYLGLEDGPSRMQLRTHKLLCRLGVFEEPVPSNFDWGSHWPLLEYGGLSAIETWLTDHPCARLVIIDVFARVRSEGSSGGYLEDYWAVVPLKELAEKYHVCILLVHHLRKKSGSSGEYGDEISGSTGLSGAADLTLVLKRAQGSTIAHLHTSGRDIEEETLCIQFDELSGLWQRIEEPAERTIISLSPEQEAVLDVLLETTESLTPMYIAQRLGKNASTVRKLLMKLIHAGLVCSVGYGLYTST